MRFLIINADDFGLTEEVNEAVRLAATDGILTSTSLLAPGYAFAEAVDAAQELPQLGIGIHTALVGGMPPVAGAAAVPSLVDENGRLLPDYVTFIRRDLAGKISYDEVYRELDTQFEKICSQPLRITHVDGHQHLHIWPKVLPVVTTLCRKYGISRMRIPQENIGYGKHLVAWKRLIGKSGLSVLAARARRYIAREGFQTTEYFWGMMDGGQLTEKKCLAMIAQMADGTHELMCHPATDDNAMQARFGWNYHWPTELATLLSSRVHEELIARNIHRIHFGDFAR